MDFTHDRSVISNAKPFDNLDEPFEFEEVLLDCLLYLDGFIHALFIFAVFWVLTRLVVYLLWILNIEYLSLPERLKVLSLPLLDQVLRTPFTGQVLDPVPDFREVLPRQPVVPDRVQVPDIPRQPESVEQEVVVDLAELPPVAIEREDYWLLCNVVDAVAVMEYVEWVN